MGESPGAAGPDQPDTKAALWSSLAWRWPVVAIIAAPMFLGAVWYGELQETTVEAVAVVAIVPQTEFAANPDLIEFAVPKYAVRMTSSPTRVEVSEQTGIDPRVLADAVEVETSAESANIRVTVSLSTEEDAIEVANAVVETAREAGTVDEFVDAEVISPGDARSTPWLTSVRAIEAVALVLGLAIGLFVAFVLERARPRMGSPREAGVIARAPVLGSLPRRRLAEHLPSALGDVATARAIGGLRSTFTAQREVARLRTVAVLGLDAGTGATTVASLLARSLSAAGESVVLLDADLVAPTTAARHGVEPAPGLTQVLAGESSLDAAVQEVDGLSIVPTTPAANPADRLARGVDDVLKQLQSDWDLTLVVTAPVLDEDSAGVVARLADAVVLVVRRRAPVARMERAVRLMEQLRAPVMGVVVNRASSREAKIGVSLGQPVPVGREDGGA